MTDARHDIDFDRALTLMDVIAKTTTVTPKNSNILGLAMDELREIEAKAKIERERIVAENQEVERLVAQDDGIDNDQDGQVDETDENVSPDTTPGQSKDSPAVAKTTPVFPKGVTNETAPRRL